MIQIGAKLASDFTDPLGVLSDCHRRIEHFLRLLKRVTEHAGAHTLNAEEREVLQTALRYFREAAPKHTADEDESLFPRLRSAEHPSAKPVLARVAELEEEHAAAQPMHARIDALGCAWLENGDLPLARRDELRGLLDQLERLYARHIRIEDEDVFPFAHAVLAPAAIAAIGHEMAQRRNLSGTAFVYDAGHTVA